ncbi:MAG: NB-ARC domain-containing protein, partial [Chloroflexota bacterium]
MSGQRKRELKKKLGVFISIFVISLGILIYSWVVYGADWERLPGGTTGGMIVLVMVAIAAAVSFVSSVLSIGEFLKTEKGSSQGTGNVEATNGSVAAGGNIINSPVHIGDIYYSSSPQGTPYIPPDLPTQKDGIAEPGKLPPGSRMVMPRNEVFTGREDDLIALAETLLFNLQGRGMTVTTGLGGVGKSQLAVEFCYRYGRYFNGVHWLSAVSSLEAELAECGRMMGIQPWPKEAEEQVAVTVKALVEGERRLVVIDNAEEVEAVQRELGRLPGNCRVLVTARRAEWPVHLGLVAHPLETLARSESLKLLGKLATHLAKDAAGVIDAGGKEINKPQKGKTKPTWAEHALYRLAERLGDLPLALDLAGRYLNERKGVTVEAYLKGMDAAGSALKHKSLMDWSKRQENPTEHKTNLAETFAMSWEQLKKGEVDGLARKQFGFACY